MQALSRKHPNLPPAPGKGERREFCSIRHASCSFIISRDVASGEILASSAGPRRSEADFLSHIQGVAASDPSASGWHFVLDNLDIHRSESLSRWVAAESDVDLELGVKGKSGIVHRGQSRAATLRDKTDRIVCNDHAQP